MKHCRKCGVELTNGNWAPSFKKNWNNICTVCNKKQCKVYHSTHHEQDLEYSQNYALENKDRIHKWNTDHRLKNRTKINDKRRVYMRDYYNNKRQEILEMHGKCCTICGSKDHLDIHHIIPVKHGNGRLHTWTDTSNLDVLCRFCHTSIHTEMGVDV